MGGSLLWSYLFGDRVFWLYMISPNDMFLLSCMFHGFLIKHCSLELSEKTFWDNRYFLTVSRMEQLSYILEEPLMPRVIRIRLSKVMFYGLMVYQPLMTI